MKALIVDMHRKMADAIGNGVAHEAILNRPSTDPGVAHPSRAQSAATASP